MPAHSREHARVPPSRTFFPPAPTHAPEPQITPGNPSEHSRQTLPPLASLHSSFPNHPPQPYVYPSPRYLPLPSGQPYNYSDGGDLSQYPAQLLPVPMHQLATGGTPQYRAGSYETQHYPPLYGPTEYFAFPSQYQPDVYRWYYAPAPPVDTLDQGTPIHVQQIHQNYSRPPAHRLPRYSNTSSSISDPRNLTASPNARSFTSAHPPDQVLSHGPPSVEKREPGNRSAVTTPLPHDRPLVRRYYHPNPPPNRSEWVMWVGNVPTDATQDELWQLLRQPSRESNGEDEDSEQYLHRAIAQFDGCQLRPHDRRCPRLVCRARRKDDDLRAGVGAQRGIGLHTSYVKNALQKVNGKGVEKPTMSRSLVPSTRVDPQSVPSTSTSTANEITNMDTMETKVPTKSPSSYASTSSSFLARHFPTRFFILKSLTQHDLDLSVERGVWATQKHNESILDQAFRTSKEVLLIFSVNKSGEFFGYARMASTIIRNGHSVSWAPRSDHSTSSSSSHVPSSESTSQSQQENSPPSDCPLADFTASQATQDVDQRHESTRNHTVTSRSRSGGDPDHTSNSVWRLRAVIEEAHGSAEEDIQSAQSAPFESFGTNNKVDVQREGEWGKTFKIDWERTERVPFHRTRHLRNPWNHGREIKVSRDGTEIEPTVGQRLIDEWQTLASEGDIGGSRRPPRSEGRRNPRPVAKPSLAMKGSKHVKEEYHDDSLNRVPAAVRKSG